MFEKLLAKRHIAHLELTPIRLKVTERMAWTPEKATQIELEYRRFLYALAHKKPEFSISPPTQDVDEFWHQHILDTRRYREDCDRIFGHYMDHTPGLNAEAQAGADLRRRKVYMEYNIDTLYFDSGGSPSDAPLSIFSSGDSHGGSGHGSSSDDGGGHGGDGGDSGGGGADGGGDGGGCGGGGCGGGCGG